MRPFALSVALFAAFPALAQSPTPADDRASADIAPIPTGTPAHKADVEGGQFFLLSDHQIHRDGEVKQFRTRVVAEVTDRAGLEDLDLKPIVPPQVCRRKPGWTKASSSAP